MSKTNKLMLAVGVIVVVVLAVWGLTRKAPSQDVATKQTPRQVKIGVVLPFTGDAASYGESMKKAIELAKKQMGLSNVSIIYEDGKCEAKTAVNAVTKLVSIDKVLGIVGEACSDATLAVAPIVEQNKVVLVSPGSTSQNVSNAGDYVFRTVPSDILQGDFGAKLVYNKGYKNLAILFINDDYGNGFKKILQDSFEKLGGRITGAEGFMRDSTDVRTQLAKIKTANPDSIYIISNTPGVGVIALKQIKELNLNIAVFGSEALKSDYVLKNAGQATEGFTVTSVSSGNNDFIKAHEQEYGIAPGPYAAQAYDAFAVMGKAIQQGAKTGEEIKNDLYGLNFDGASGRIKFDSNGDISGNYDVFVVKDGQYVLEK